MHAADKTGYTDRRTTGAERPWAEDPWRKRALCRVMGTHPSVFYPEKGPRPVRGPGADTRAMVAQARKICDLCPVRIDCLEFAMLDGQWWWGVWGGLTARERRKLRSRWKTLRLTITQGIEIERVKDIELKRLQRRMQNAIDRPPAPNKR